MLLKTTIKNVQLTVILLLRLLFFPFAKKRVFVPLPRSPSMTQA